MNYLSVCSGIEAATVAWHDIGWNPVGFSEIEPFPSAVISNHYPDVTNFGDMTKFKEWNLDPNGVDLLVGGTPCQSFSVAGLRKGLDDPRGNLALTYCSMLDHFRPTWFVWENVPGVLSSNGGRDFGSFLGAVAELGYGFAYRVLDAQYFGVAQRRRRVFVVGHFGNWQRAAAVLFERESLRRDTAPSREARKAVAGTISSRTTDGGGLGNDFECSGGLQPIVISSGADPHTMATLCATDAAKWGSNQWVKEGKAVLQPAYGIPGNWIGRAPENGGNAVEPMHDVAPCLTKTDQHGVAHPIAFGVGETPDTAHCLRSGASRADKHESTTYVAQPFQQTSDCLTAAYGTKWNGNASADNGSLFASHGMSVRRLTPVECERLQGFPDNYTNIPWRKKDESPDGHRYKALGNSMAVPVMRWIGERINQVKEIA